MYKNWLRRLAATGAVLSVGGMALLCGCNHDRDCDSCDTHPAPVVGPRVSDTTIMDEGAQPTSFGDTVEAAPQFENDIYFRDHRNDANFDRDAYFRDRAAYIRAHEGDQWWNDHHTELEASWRPGFRAEGDIYFRDHRNDPNFDRDAYLRDRGAYIRAHGGDAYWNEHRAELEKSWGTGVRANVNPETNRDFNRNTETRNFDRDHQMNTSTDRQMNASNRDLNRDTNAQPKSDLNANAPKSEKSELNANAPKSEKSDLNANAPKTDTNLNTNNTEVKSRSDANLPKSDVNAPKANTPPVRSSTEAGATMPSSSEKSAESRNLKEQNEALNTSTSSTNESSSASKSKADMDKDNAAKLDHNDAAKFDHSNAAPETKSSSNSMKDQGSALNTSNNTSSSGNSATSTTKSSNNAGSETNGSAGAQGTTAPGSSTKGTTEKNGSSSNNSGASSGGM